MDHLNSASSVIIALNKTLSSTGKHLYKQKTRAKIIDNLKISNTHSLGQKEHTLLGPFWKIPTETSHWKVFGAVSHRPSIIT